MQYHSIAPMSGSRAHISCNSRLEHALLLSERECRVRMDDSGRQGGGEGGWSWRREGRRRIDAVREHARCRQPVRKPWHGEVWRKLIVMERIQRRQCMLVEEMGGGGVRVGRWEPIRRYRQPVRQPWHSEE